MRMKNSEKVISFKLFFVLIFFCFFCSTIHAAEKICNAGFANIASKAFSAHPLSPEEISYKIFGENNKEVLVLIHGLDSAMQTFNPIVEKLAAKYKVLVYDQRGHGKTVAEGMSYTNTIMAEDLKVLLDHLGIKKANILGHSMGGRTAVRFADLHPECIEKIVIEDMEMIKRTKSSLEEVQKKSIDIIEKTNLLNLPKVFSNHTEAFKALEAMYGRETESILNRRAITHKDGSIELLFRPYISVLYGMQGNAEDLGPALQKIRSKNIPILFLHAEPNQSAMSDNGIRQIKEMFPHTNPVISIENATHNIHGSQSEKFLNTVNDFLSEKKIK